MSSHRRPWYKWYPKDFTADEKVQCLPPVAELIYRRALDLMWQSNVIRIPNAMPLLYQSLGRGIESHDFEAAWERIQYPDFELFRVSEDGKWLYSARLQSEALDIEDIVNKRKAAGKKAAEARWNQAGCDTHTKRIPNAYDSHCERNSDAYPSHSIASGVDSQNSDFGSGSSPKSNNCAKEIPDNIVNPILCDTHTKRIPNAYHTDTDTDINTPLPPKGDGKANSNYTSDFLEFWKHYPRKETKGAAFKAWKKIGSPKEILALIQTALIWQKKSEQWTKENGKYIPQPATYLNGRKWEDEPTGTTPKPVVPTTFEHQYGGV